MKKNQDKTRRADYKLIKALTKQHGHVIGDYYQSMPLIVIDEDTFQFLLDLRDGYRKNHSKAKVLENVSEWVKQFTSCLILFESKALALAYQVAIKKDNEGNDVIAMQWDIFGIYKDKDGKDHDWDYLCSLASYSNDAGAIMYDRTLLDNYFVIDNIQEHHLAFKDDSNMEPKVRKIFSEYAGMFTCLIGWHLEEQKAPVECRPKGIPHKAIHEKRPYLKPAVTVKFLGALPSKNTDTPKHKGGSHRSPHSHYRRAHTRTLKDKKYKSNPNYGIEGGVKIPAMWIGDTSVELDGIEYRVKLPSDAVIKKEKTK